MKVSKMKISRYLLILIILPFFTFGCAHTLIVSPTGITKKMEESNKTIITQEKIGIKNLEQQDKNSLSLYNAFKADFQALYNGDVINSYTTEYGKVDKVIEVVITDIKYNVNYFRSFLIQFPGSFIFMPGWNGLSYSVKVDWSLNISNGLNCNIFSNTYTDEYIINYTHSGRGVCSEGGFWLTPFTIGGLITAFVPSSWDDQMKDRAISIISSDGFGQAVSSRIIEELNKENISKIKPIIDDNKM